MNKVLIAMSGGVDSSAAAVCIKNMGHTAAGATMVMFDGGTVAGATDEGVRDARLACETLGMDFFTLDAREEFRREVMEDFVSAYMNGETPNPCLVCNKKLKFGMFLDYAEKNGFDKIATGHYAIVKKQGDRFILCRGRDARKDQTYVLYSLTQNVLSKLMLPLGELTKDEVRELAGQSALNTATKKESQDICFVPDGDYAGFIERFTGIIPPEGDFVLRDGTVIGRHKGLIRYTVGQHKKLGLGIHIPYYVTAKNAAHNEIILGSDEDLFAKEVRAVDVNFMAFDKLDAPLRVKAKLRYRHTEQDAWVYPEEDGVTVVFDEAQRAPTPGQAVVFYDGDVVLGGGKII